DSEPACRAGERPLLHDGHEALELPELHRRILFTAKVLRLWTYRGPGKRRATRRATALNHVSFSAVDLEESVRFYESVLGLERIPTPTFEMPVQWLRIGSLQLHIFAADPGAEPPQRHHLGL